MEIKDLVNSYGIIGVISNYKCNFDLNNTILELHINNLNSALKIVGLQDNILNKKLKDLALNELFKVDLATKLNNEIIIIGNLSNMLDYKDLEFIKKLLIKLYTDYHKKIVVIDNELNTFFNLTNKIVIMQNKTILYISEDFYDKNLYKYVKIPKIIDFVNYVNRYGKVLENNIDIYELIKDIYRSVS